MTQISVVCRKVSVDGTLVERQFKDFATRAEAEFFLMNRAKAPNSIYVGGVVKIYSRFGRREFEILK